MSKILCNDEEKISVFSPINISEWDNVDCVSIKAREGVLQQSVYLLEGHALYEANMTQEDKDFVDFIKGLGCYGISEKMFSKNELWDKFYVKTNIKTDEQLDEIFRYFDGYIHLTRYQWKVLEILKGLESILDANEDYKPLYHLAFVKSKNIAGYSQIRFYFKTFAADEDIRFDKECLYYLEKYAIFKDESLFKVIKNLVFSKKAGLRCIGFELGENHSTRIKYYLCESTNGIPLQTALVELSSFPYLSKNSLALLETVGLFQNCKCNWMQVATGLSEEDITINLYFGPLYRQKRKFYQLKKGIVLRNIGGVYFLIDIHAKDYYESKRLFALNEIGKEIVGFLMLNRVCTVGGIVSHIKSQIVNYMPEMNDSIYEDCNAFVTYLLKNGFLVEVT